VELAKRLAKDGVAHLRAQTLNGWVSQAGYPQPERVSQRPGQPHGWRYATVLKWFAADGTGQAKIDEREIRRRKLAADALLAELELAIAKKRFIPIDEFKKAASAMVVNCRSKLLGMGSKLGPLLAIETDPRECLKLIQKEAEEALEEIQPYPPKPRKVRKAKRTRAEISKAHC